MRKYETRLKRDFSRENAEMKTILLQNMTLLTYFTFNHICNSLAKTDSSKQTVTTYSFNFVHIIKLTLTPVQKTDFIP